MEGEALDLVEVCCSSVGDAGEVGQVKVGGEKQLHRGKSEGGKGE